MLKIPEHGYCFVCGSSSKKGLNATLFLIDDGSVCCEYEFDINFQGPPGFVHGAASFSLLDEVMGICAWSNGYNVLLRHMDIDYFKMVPLYKRIKAIGRIENVEENRKIFVIGEIVYENEVYIRARGLYILVENELLGNVKKVFVNT